MFYTLLILHNIGTRAWLVTTVGVKGDFTHLNVIQTVKFLYNCPWLSWNITRLLLSVVMIYCGTEPLPQ